MPLATIKVMSAAVIYSLLINNIIMNSKNKNNNIKIIICKLNIGGIKNTIKNKKKNKYNFLKFIIFIFIFFFIKKKINMKIINK